MLYAAGLLSPRHCAGSCSANKTGSSQNDYFQGKTRFGLLWWRRATRRLHGEWSATTRRGKSTVPGLNTDTGYCMLCMPLFRKHKNIHTYSINIYTYIYVHKKHTKFAQKTFLFETSHLGHSESGACLARSLNFAMCRFGAKHAASTPS